MLGSAEKLSPQNFWVRNMPKIYKMFKKYIFLFEFCFIIAHDAK